MKIKKIEIHDFRSLSNVVIDNLDPHLNLLMGVNGAGKSSVLDACDDLGHFLGFAFHAALESHFKRGALAVVHCKITCRRIVICGCSVIVQGIDEG